MTAAEQQDRTGVSMCVCVCVRVCVRACVWDVGVGARVVACVSSQYNVWDMSVLLKGNTCECCHFLR